MLKELPHKRLIEWQEYDLLDPIGNRRGDWQVAAICASLWNIAAARSRSKKVFTPSDFLLEWKESEDPVMERKVPAPAKQPWQVMKSIGQLFAAADAADRAQAEAREEKKRKKRHG